MRGFCERRRGFDGGLRDDGGGDDKAMKGEKGFRMVVDLWGSSVIEGD